jgi:hypothetical protein
MKNLVRGGVILSLIGMFVIFIYAQTKTENVLNIAKDSQPQLNNTEDLNKEAVIEQQDNNKKLIDKTVSSKAAGISKGSFVATAYCLRGKTAMGHGVRSGLIAADPRSLQWQLSRFRHRRQDKRTQARYLDGKLLRSTPLRQTKRNSQPLGQVIYN